MHILCDDEDIPKSPYIAHIMPKGDFHPELVSGPSGGGLIYFQLFFSLFFYIYFLFLPLSNAMLCATFPSSTQLPGTSSLEGERNYEHNYFLWLNGMAGLGIIFFMKLRYVSILR